MAGDKYYIVSDKVIPEVFKKVLEVKESLLTGKYKDISEATKNTGISRSTFYKYKDYIFPMSEGINSKKITLVVLLSHEAGTLSKVLDCIAFNKGNILTISQDIPINMAANVTITIDIANMTKDIKHLVNTLRLLQNVISVKVLAME
ncbi:MAG: ACT domain-containing protein [Clostridium sp.]|uniref:ACT domain-containing protein n=1 Tax=Clostridium sp. TaxID=1506 RepID=UPI00290DC8D7|nr:ACT domain-containing protein [Clostridium sp.]MDU5110430.1 ACT domain-containing protein [Clostridium sp.]